jgi:mannitol-1-phosphate 5-dehydrogenase
MNSQPHLLIAGAGNIGRGLLAALAAPAGWQVTFLEASLPFAQRLRAADGYCLTESGSAAAPHKITGFELISPDQPQALAEALGCADLCASAVGGANLDSLAALLAPGLARRTRPLPIILCENMHGAADRMQAALAAAKVPPQAFVCRRASVESMVVAARQNSLDLIAEGGQSLFVDATDWPGQLPAIPGIEFTRRIDFFYDRKLFTNNAGHALLAYRGALCGCTLLADALDDPQIHKDLCNLLCASVRMLAAEHQVPPHELEAHIDDLLTRRFANRALGDTVRRVARQPLRKLGPHERLVGLARLLQHHGLFMEPVARTIAAAMLYVDEADTEAVQLHQLLEQQGAAHVLETVCAIPPADPLHGECLEAFVQLAPQAAAIPRR